MSEFIIKKTEELSDNLHKVYVERKRSREEIVLKWDKDNKAIFHGKYKSFRLDGTKLIECFFENNKTHGIYKKFDFDETIIKIDTEQNNETHGVALDFFYQKK